MPTRRLPANFRPFLLICPCLTFCFVTDVARSDDVVSEAAPAGEGVTDNENEPKINLPEASKTNPFRNVSRSRRARSKDKLVQLCQETVDTTARRLLSTDQHTPWQMIHAILGLRQDFSLLHNGGTVSGLDWIAEGQIYDNEYWFEKTRFGGRAHPYSRPYAFEGHANQTIALLSMSGVELDREFGTATGPITMRQMIQHAQMSVSSKDEPTWTLWVLSRYLPPNARWRNAAGEYWSIEKLVQIQTAKPMKGAPCGGTHGMFALAHARNVYQQQGNPLRGVWLQAEAKIRRYAATARQQQNPNGSLSSNYFRGREYNPDFNKRMASVGHVLEFLMLALPQEELNSRWVRRAIESAARDLMNNRKAYVKCSPLYHTVNALNIYLDRVNPRLPDEIALDSEPLKTAETRPRGVPVQGISQGRDLGKEADRKEANETVVIVEEPTKMKIQPAKPKEVSVETRKDSTSTETKVTQPRVTQEKPKPVTVQDDGKWTATPKGRRGKIEVPTDKVGGISAAESSTKSVIKAAEPTVESSEGSSRSQENEPSTDEAVEPSDPAPMPESADVPPSETIKDLTASESKSVRALAISDSTTIASGDQEKTSTSENSPNSSKVPDGINEAFLAVDLDATVWQKKFEVESREIFAARDAIVKALSLKSGMTVADVGCGTGLFVQPLSDAVQEDGRVFAIDISPRFVEFLERRISDEELENVVVVRNDATSLQLMKNRVDRVLLCDTYHHFEQPKAMLSSIFDSLEPGGELLLIDFERIPGKSREWVVNHVRADKATFRAEIQAAGFEFLDEVKIPEFKENYCLRFRRPTL